MTNVKICGLKREEDIIYVNKLKPDYVGFVFAKSSRQIDKYRAKKLIMGLDKGIKKVGVFSNHSIGKVKEIAEFCNLDILQFHGDEDPIYCNSFENTVWKAFRIKDGNILKKLEEYDVDGFLLDTFARGTYGGTGKSFDWKIVSNASENKFIILAGGLTSENVEDAIEIVKPQVVDVSSGVEVCGVKDFEKIKKFIKKVRG
ncbi:phosphoribosylanthranilate isomerase [Crassaminicella thermophila]|uniref:N-(5'-phosphoribosyl)anthranilate isomerase n=1 Tax=Crassaminicella thermophila TaxID=2599308 RepID=A0A5C0SC71_CRATE|nr:phosphoribosylanthranilate isomerase [Crassaminicella thermophila]QEK11761.1 phosphoribosylanthranilate isomerase [Crassaminicella thermophila]